MSLNDEDALRQIEHYLQDRCNPQNAVAYFADKMSGIDPSFWRRIPQTLNFPIGPDKKLFEFIQSSVDHKAIDGKAIKHLPPSAVFAVCSGIAYSMESEYASLLLAKRYSELCLESCLSEQGEGFLCASQRSQLPVRADRQVPAWSFGQHKSASKHFKKAISHLSYIERAPTPTRSTR